MSTVCGRPQGGGGSGPCGRLWTGGRGVNNVIFRGRHKWMAPKLKVLAWLDHGVHFLTSHLKIHVCHALLSCSPLSIKSNSEVSTWLLLRDFSFKLRAVDLFSNTSLLVHRHRLFSFHLR